MQCKFSEDDKCTTSSLIEDKKRKHFISHKVFLNCKCP